MGVDVKSKVTMAVYLIVFIVVLLGITPMVTTQFTAAQAAANAATYSGNTSVAAFWALAPFLWGLFIALVVIMAIIAELKF
jgi:heme/copper-type cytochrome/quinol oxidase subunit 2